MHRFNDDNRSTFGVSLSALLMGDIVEIKLSQFPECWETCGTCASDDIEVAEVLVSAGDRVALYDPLMVLELAKIDWEINADQPGTVLDVFISPGDVIDEGEVLMLLELLD